MNLYGQLIYNDNAEFELEDETGIINISNLLDGIYNAKQQAYIRITKGSSLLFEEDGAIIKKQDSDGIVSNFVCGNNLDLLLFNNTDEVLQIIIKKRRKYGNERNKRQI